MEMTTFHIIFLYCVEEGGGWLGSWPATGIFLLSPVPPPKIIGETRAAKLLGLPFIINVLWLLFNPADDYAPLADGC